MVSYYSLEVKPFSVPSELVKRFRIQTRDDAGGWVDRVVEENNYQRLVWVPLNAKTNGIRLIPEEPWGSGRVRVFAIDVYPREEVLGKDSPA